MLLQPPLCKVVFEMFHWMSDGARIEYDVKTATRYSIHIYTVSSKGMDLEMHDFKMAPLFGSLAVLSTADPKPHRFRRSTEPMKPEGTSSVSPSDFLVLYYNTATSNYD